MALGHLGWSLPNWISRWLGARRLGRSRWRFFDPGGRPGPGLPGFGALARSGSTCQVRSTSAAEAPAREDHSHSGSGLLSPGRYWTCSRMRVPSMTGSSPLVSGLVLARPVAGLVPERCRGCRGPAAGDARSHDVDH